MTIRGVDVSVAQGVLGLGDWRAMAQGGLRFASVRCGNGNGPRDSRFAANVAGAGAAGLVLQAYGVYFGLPVDPAHAGREARVQARNHFAQSGGLGSGPRTLAPCVDLEYPAPQDWAKWGSTGQMIVDGVADYLDETERLCGRLPYVYSYKDYLDHLALSADLSRLARYPLWAAEYGVATPYVIPPWRGCVVWQRSGGGGRLPNGAAVDEDVFEGDEAAFLLASNQPVDVTDGHRDDPVHPPIDPEAG